LHVLSFSRQVTSWAAWMPVASAPIVRFRSPCSSYPLPMPIETRFAFALPKHAARVYRETSCTIPPHGD
jgi:hypothetical protein